MPDSTNRSLRKLPLPNTTKADKVIKWLEDFVDSNHLKVGDSLPHESVVVEGTGLSRTCVREALSRLRALGIIESRRHAGSRLVRPMAAHNLMRVLAARELPEAALGHVGGMRSALELGFLREMFDRAGAEKIADLRAITERMEASTNERAAFFECELAFHGKLIEITDNAMAYWLWQMLVPFFQKISQVRMPIPDGVVEKHRAIVEALAARDRTAFEREMHRHHDHKLAWDSERYEADFLDPQYAGISGDMDAE